MRFVVSRVRLSIYGETFARNTRGGRRACPEIGSSYAKVWPSERKFFNKTYGSISIECHGNALCEVFIAFIYARSVIRAVLNGLVKTFCKFCQKWPKWKSVKITKIKICLNECGGSKIFLFLDPVFSKLNEKKIHWRNLSQKLLSK